MERVKGQEGDPTIGSLEHFNPSKNTFTSKAMREHLGIQDGYDLGGMHKAGFAAFLAKFSYDAMDAKTAMVMDVAGDPGAFVKLNNKTGQVDVSKTATKPW